MATPMDPYAPLPSPDLVTSTARHLTLAQRATAAEARLATAPRERKPLRAQKERLPVAREIDPEQLLRPAGPLTPGAGPLPIPAAPPAPLPPSPAPAVSFDGVVDDDTSIPPDTNGAVGPVHLFNPLNNRIQVFDRTGASLLDLPLDDFWQANAFDPRVVFEPFRGRFVFVSMADAEKPTSALLIAVSETDDPTGNWFTSSVPVDPARQGDVWLDYPCIGFSADKITVQVNLFTLAGNQFAGSSIYVWDTDQLFNPPHTASPHLFMLTNQGGTQMPASTYDPGQNDHFLVSRWTGNSQGDGFYALYAVTGSIPAGNLALNRVGFIQATGVIWDSFPPTRDFAPQQGTPQRLATGDDRILGAVFRNGTLWLSHTVFLPAGGPTRASAQWLQAQSGTWNVLQIGRIDDPTGQEFYAFPTLAVNQKGRALIGMSRFTATQFASSAYAIREPSDPPGTMRTPNVYMSGLNSYFKTFGGGINRWGDYSSTQVDPLNDLDLWTIQEYASANQNFWATRWAQVT